jgi:crossover junction endodeoxyribonuclease RusA
MTTIALTLPYPPSVNSYWRCFRGRAILSREGREYRDRIVFEQRLDARLQQQIDGPVEVQMMPFPPDARRRDLDNILKCANDALKRLNIIEDDSLIRRAVQEWGEIDRENPRVEVTIKPYKRVTP